ncbi:MAG: heparan-alpha-glucosaminide N-acetyltransferase domain-containing protein [Bryobacterales bacterium]|jgi:predicted acyltransferase|nr:heparan-alpha-glucosaminide N-acetyltransferase domain-containing protein [Bryobacterales bacterium]
MQPSDRLVSLDAFRGATIAAMILVNNAGSFQHAYQPLLHVPWHGWTFTDCIMPSFLWIVGVAMTFSFAKRVERGDSKRNLMLHSVRRGAIIIGLGLFLYLFPEFDFANMRYPGVLQRIGICYILCSAIFLWSSWKGVLAWTVGCLVSYWMMLTLVPVPGYGPGVLTPMGNFAGYVDRLLITGHMWTKANDWDPEGVLSTIPSISTMLFGVLAGYLLRRPESRERVIGWIFFGGACLVFLGSWMDHFMPINKMIWTPSFAVLMAGISATTFACFYWLVDVRGLQRWAKPAVILGMNAITIYMFASLLEGAFIDFKLVPVAGEWVSPQRFMDRYVLGQFLSPENVSLVYSIGMVLVAFVVALAMYRKKWFVRV